LFYAAVKIGRSRKWNARGDDLWSSRRSGWTTSLVFTTGKALESVYLLGFVYLVLSFPTGRLQGKLDRALILAAVTLVTVVAGSGGLPQ
jgi:hypothetical protein